MSTNDEAGAGLFDDPRLTAMGLLAETFTALMAKMMPTLGASKLAGTDFEVLLRLGRSDCHRLRMTDLATQTALSTSGITRVVDRLAARGLVSRESCASDRRGSFAVLTGAGRELLTGLVRSHVRDIDRWFTGLLTSEQLDALLSALRVVRDEVHPGATAGSGECAAALSEVGPPEVALPALVRPLAAGQNEQ